MKKLILCLLFLPFMMINLAEAKDINSKDYTDNRKEVIWKEIDEISKNCRSISLTEEEKLKYKDSYDAFADMIPLEQKRMSCLKEHIKEYALSHYGQNHWKNIEKQLKPLEEVYTDIYLTISCPTWPNCPKLLVAAPYIDYYSLLEKLLYDMHVYTEKLNMN